MDFDKLRTQLENRVGVSGIAKNIRILLVDNDTTSLMFLASQLEQRKYEVTTIESASVALSLFQERKSFYNIVLADYHMPEMPALVFTRKILSTCPTMPVLLMARDVIENIAAEAICRGVCFFFMKPLRDCDVRDLWQHVVRATGKIPEPQNHNFYLDLLRKGNLSSGGSSSGAQNGKYCNLKRNSLVKVNQRREKNRVSEYLSDSCESDEDTKNNKRPRMCWSPSLHAKFLKAIEILGESKAYPKALLKVMREPGLTHRQVASHLQKYRNKKRNQASPQAVEGEALPPIKLPTPVLNMVPRVNYWAAQTPSSLNGSNSGSCRESVKQKLDALDYSVNNAVINSGGVQVQVSQGNGAGGQLGQGNRVGAEVAQGINPNHENSIADGDQVPCFPKTFSHIVMTGDNIIVHPNPNQERAREFLSNFSQVTVTDDNAIPYSVLNRQQAIGFPQNFGQATMTGCNVIPSSNPNGEQGAGFPQNFGKQIMTGSNVIPYFNPNGEKATGFAHNSDQVTMATTSMVPTGNELINGSNMLNQGPASDFGMGVSGFGNFGEWTVGANQRADNASEGMACNYDINYLNRIIQDFDAAGGVDNWDPSN